MIQVPPDLIRPLFNEKLERGRLFRLADYPLLSGRKAKYLVVLNVNREASSIYHALTTSQVARYQALRFGEYGVLMKASSAVSLPLDTIIDCFSLPDPLEREYLFVEFCRGNLKALEVLPSEAMQSIDVLLVKSPRIAPATKREIIPGYGGTVTQ